MRSRTMARAAVGILAVASATLVATSATGAPVASSAGGHPAALPGGSKHLVVIYEENHSFDNLYGEWGAVNGRPSTAAGASRRSPRTARHTAASCRTTST